MRGTLAGTVPVDAVHGIIPAYAGNTPAYAGNTFGLFFLYRRQGDHPRVCGEHAPAERRHLHRLGSSPRMRGTPDQRANQHGQSGIIPAYAGNTGLTLGFDTAKEDHPRVCGEHTLTQQGIDVAKGSSPRMRGTRHHSGRRAADRGIIPAYAGNTCRAFRPPVAVWDHPRVCGEHFLRSEMRKTFPGSSPRMRGTLQVTQVEREAVGIIPAYAGNTRPCRTLRRWSWDHPRVCGEHD